MKTSIPDHAFPIRGSIPVRHTAYKKDELNAWLEAKTAWIRGDRKDRSALGVFSELASAGRIISFNEAPRRHGFAEARVALELEQRGYTCWTGVQLFPWSGRKVQAPDRKRNTDEVMAAFERQGLVFPKLLQPRLRGWEMAHGTRIRNPDLVCLHRKMDTWLFIEVKRERETVEPGQWAALAVLRWLTGGDVEVRRLVSARALPADYEADEVTVDVSEQLPDPSSAGRRP